MAGDLAMATVLSLGCAMVGAPEALRLLLDLAGQSSPIAGVVVIVGVICAVTAATVLGAMLLVRFIRVAGNAPDPPTERFARVTLTVAVAVALLVAACLLAVPTVPSATFARA